MKILCFIDSLNSGGAQKQITNLAVLLHNRGFNVSVLTYHNYNFFHKTLDDLNIPVAMAASGSRTGRFLAILKHLDSIKPDLVIAFLKTPSMISELCGLMRPGMKVIVSERSGVTDQKPTVPETLRYHAHRLADAVVVNSHSLKDHLAKYAPWLSDKTYLVVNGVDLDRFNPGRYQTVQTGKFKVLTIGRICPDKNPRNFIFAAELLMRRCKEHNFEFQWYGNSFIDDGKSTELAAYSLEALELSRQRGLSGIMTFHDPVPDVVRLYQEADVFCLPSIRESCPNVIAEAMACGKPIVASRVGDIPRMVQEGENGFLCDPTSSADIAEKLVKLASLNAASRRKMGHRSRQLAQELFSEQRFLSEFLSIIAGVSSSRGVIQ